MEIVLQEGEVRAKIGGFPRPLPAETPAEYRERLDPEQLAQVALEMPDYSSWPSPRLPSRAFDERGSR